MRSRAPWLWLLVIAACTPGAAPVVAPPPPPVEVSAPREDPCPQARAAQARAPALLAAGQLDRTVRVLRRAAERCPAVAAAGRPNLAKALARLGRKAAAIAELDAIDRDNTSTAEMRRSAAAERVAWNAPAAPPPSPADLAHKLAEADALLSEGLATSARSKIESARSLYQALADTASPDGDALHGAARAARALGDAPAAQELFDRAVVALSERAGVEAYVDIGTDLRGTITSAAWSRNAERLAVTGDDAVTVYDMRAMREHGRIEGFAFGIAFAGEIGDLLAVARDGKMEVIDSRTLLTIRTIETPCEPMAASPRAPIAVCSARDGTATIWDLDRGRAIHTLRDLGPSPIALRFSDDGKTILSLTKEALTSWDVDRGKRRGRVAARRGAELREIRPLRDNKTIALLQAPPLEEAHEADRLDAKTLAARGRMPIAKVDEESVFGPPRQQASEPGLWSPDGRFYLSFTDPSLYDRAGAKSPLLGPHARSVLSAGFSGDGKVFGAGYEGGAFRSFDADTGRMRKLYQQTWAARALAFRSDRGEYIARVASSPRTAWSADGRVEARAHKQLVIVRNAKDEKVCEGEGGTDDILFVAVSPDGGEVVTLSATEALFWDAARCTVTAPLPKLPGSMPMAGAFTLDGDSFAIAWRGARNELRVVDLASRTDRLVAPLESVYLTRRVFIPPGGRAVAVSDPLQIWELDGSKPVPHGAVRGSVLAMSRDGKMALSAEPYDGALRFSEIRTGELVVALRALGDSPSAYAFVDGATPADTLVEPLDDKAREGLICRIGPRAHTFDLCAERSEVPNLFAKAMRGDRSFLEP